MLLTGYFNHGIRRAYLFAIHSADGYGLLESDFKPRALMFSVEGAPESVHSLTLQKKSGEWLLLIWNEKLKFWQPDKRDIYNDAVPVTLKISTPLQQSVEILTQNDKGAYDPDMAEIKDGSLTIPVPSSVAIVKLKPTEDAKWETTATAAPSGSHWHRHRNGSEFLLAGCPRRRPRRLPRFPQ